MREGLAALGLVAFSTPVTGQTIHSAATIATVSSPSAGGEHLVTVGSAVYEYVRFVPVDVAFTDQPMKGGALNWLRLGSGEPLFSVDTKAAFKACAAGGEGICGIDDDGDGKFDRIAQDWVSFASKLKAPISYRTEKWPRPLTDNLKETIVYAGATGDTLRLSYREFRNDFARPAFTEELSIPLGKTYPQMIAVKAIKLRLLSLDGMGLRYELLK